MRTYVKKLDRSLHVRVGKVDLDRLQLLAKRWEMSEAQVVRELVRRAAEQEAKT